MTESRDGQLVNGPRGRLSSPATAAVLLGVGVVLGFVAGAQPWWRAVGGDLSVAFSGVQASAGLTQALSGTAAAATLLLLVLGRRGRQLTGGILGLVGAAQTAVGLARFRPGAEAVGARVREVSLTDQFALHGTAWGWVYAAAGLLVLAGGLAVLVGAGRWAAATRFAPRRVAGPRAAADGSPSPVSDAPPPADDPTALWRAQDQGLDPTGDEHPHPDVRPGPRRDTMGES